MESHANWLSSFWSVVHRHPRIAANFLFPNHPKGYVRSTEMLGNFAINSSVAMKARLEGDINAASVYEHASDLIYSELPDYAKDVADGLGNYDEAMIEPLMVQHGQRYVSGYGLKPWVEKNPRRRR